MRSSRLESGFQDRLIAELMARFPDCMIFKLEKQGVPDLLILYGNKWAALECKRSSSAHHQPNQDYYVRRMEKMSFSRFIFPENRDEVLEQLSSFFLD